MNNTQSAHNLVVEQATVQKVHTMLKVVYGIVPILAGLDKFGFNYITQWTHYINPMILAYVPLSALQFMYIVGAIEIVAGVIVLSKWTRYGAYLVAAWLVLIALSLFAMGKFIDIGIRDVVMAIGALALAMLSPCLCKK